MSVQKDFLLHSGCEICSEKAHNHLVRISNKAIDEPWNLIQLCLHHEEKWNLQGWRVFCFYFPKMKRILTDKGWKMSDFGIVHVA